jgi:hypothetical protein
MQFRKCCCSLIFGSPLHFHDHTSVSLSYSLLHPLAETVDGMFLRLHVLSQLLQECLEHKQAFTDWILQVTHWLQPMSIDKQELLTYNVLWYLFFHEEPSCFLTCMFVRQILTWSCNSLQATMLQGKLNLTAAAVAYQRLQICTFYQKYWFH